MNLKEKIKVMQHFADGGKIETGMIGSKWWWENSTPTWNFEKCKYRIKKEPVIRWAITYPIDEGQWVFNTFDTEIEVIESAKSKVNYKIIKLVEDMDYVPPHDRHKCGGKIDVEFRTPTKTDKYEAPCTCEYNYGKCICS